MTREEKPIQLAFLYIWCPKEPNPRSTCRTHTMWCKYFNNNNNNLLPHPQFNQTPYNHTGYGRPTPHPPQGMNNLPPPPLGPSWNMNQHLHPPPPPPPPPHQGPSCSTNFTASTYHQNLTFPFQMNNTNNRNQFQQATGPHHLPYQPPPGPVHLPIPPNPYGHHPPSQFMMPQMYHQGGEMLHQGCAMPGGPAGGPQNEMFFNNHLTDQQLQNIQNINFNVPPNHPPLKSHHQNNFRRDDTGFPQHVPWRFDHPEALPYPHKGHFDPMAKEMNQGMYNQWAAAPLPQTYESSSHPIEPTRNQPHPQFNPSRWTPAKNVLERNTAAQFDESSEELAEIFAGKPNRGTHGSETCSDRSSVRTTSSGYVFHSDDDGFDILPNEDEEFGSKRVFSEGTIKQGHTQATCQKPVPGPETQTLPTDVTNNNYMDNSKPSPGIKPTPGFTNMSQHEQPPADQLQKVGNYLKGLLKVDVSYCHDNTHSKPATGQEKHPGRKSKSPNDGPTIRSLIDRPIYNNCESRLMNKNSKSHRKEKADVIIPGRPIKRINIQRITSHFRVLFEPIPDMFAD